LYPASRAWEETLGGHSPAGDDYLRLTPARHGTDGFFVAQFERRPVASPHPNPPPQAGAGVIGAPSATLPRLREREGPGPQGREDGGLLDAPTDREPRT